MGKEDEIMNSMSTRNVSGVNRAQSPQDALDATERKQFTTKSAVNSMPRGEGENVELRFFDLDYDPTPTELDAEYKSRNLKADFFALAKHMQDDPAFADECPVVCQWDLGENGVASYAVFHRWRDERSVDVDRYGNRWNRLYRFAGVCK
jgi:hypothetical protein